jgi:hypothetical protein
MPLIHSLLHAPGSDVRLGTSVVSLLFLSCGLLVFSDAARCETDAPQGAPRAIVAAGFGYQIGDISTITVKVYDAGSGDILSDETFDLNVKEGEAARTEAPRERIFAGGVGLGATDLSSFTLRVYDAKTGRFQWEGQLNLKPGEENGGAQVVSAVVPRRATVTRIHMQTPARQPLFVLRAWDPLTGGLVWQDEFSADFSRLPKIEQIVHRPMATGSADLSHTFDFSIRMFDGGTVRWEDRFASEETEEAPHEAADDQASMLPAWPGLFEQEPAARDL